MTRVTTLLKHPSAFIPLMMSLAALALLLTVILRYGTAPQEDEGAAAHLWQLLMAAQAPIVLFFAFRWVPQAPREAAIILTLQVLAALTTIAPIFLMGW